MIKSAKEVKMGETTQARLPGTRLGELKLTHGAIQPANFANSAPRPATRGGNCAGRGLGAAWLAAHSTITPGGC